MLSNVDTACVDTCVSLMLFYTLGLIPVFLLSRFDIYIRYDLFFSRGD